MSFIDELKKIELEKNNGDLNNKEELLISTVKKMIIDYVKIHGMEGTYCDIIRLKNLDIEPSDINTIKLHNHMKREGLEINFEFVNLSGTHDILVKLLFTIDNEFALRFKVKFK